MKTLYKKNDKKAALEGLLYDAFTNNGIVGLPDEDKTVVQLEFKDIFELPNIVQKQGISDEFTTKDLNRFVETSVTKVIREALEPNLLIIPNLFQEIQYSGRGRSIEIGALGHLHAAVVPEGSEYPERSFDMGSGSAVMVSIEKHGLKIRVTEEVIEENLFDVFGLWLRMAGRALARHKEEYGLKLLNEFGFDLYDNDNPGNAELGATNGRGIDGAKNNTMTVDDLFEMYAWLYIRGFQPDTLIMNPLAWKMFMSDPETREIVLKGATLATNRLPQGSYAQAFGTSHNGLGLRTTATGVALEDPNKVAGNNPFVTSLNPLGATFNIPPRYLPTPMKVLVTPYLPFTPVNGGKPKTDIIMADSSRAGILLTKEGVSIDEWNDVERDIRAMKIKERYGLAILEQGKGIGVARNITVDRNYVFENVNQVTLS